MTEINKNEGEWKFDEQVAPAFDAHVRASVPMYDAFHDMIADFSKYFVEDSTNVYDLGTSTGEALKRVIKANEKKFSVNYIGYDNSEAMLNKARCTTMRGKFKLINLAEDDFILKNASFVTSVLTMQFIPLSARIEVLKKIHAGLNKGSAFVLVEKVLASDSAIHDIFATEYEKFKFDNELSREHIFDKKQSLKGVMKPLTEFANRALLNEAGFYKIETFFRWNNFIGFIAVK